MVAEPFPPPSAAVVPRPSSSHRAGAFIEIVRKSPSIAREVGAGEAFDALRAFAATALTECPAPQANEEWWRYTTPDQFPWGMLSAESPVRIRLSVEGARNDALPPGVAFFTGEAAGNKIAALSDEIDYQITHTGYHAVALLHRATTGGVAFIHVSKSAQIDVPLVIHVSPTVDRAQAVVEAPTVVILAEAGSRCSFVEDWKVASGSFAMARVDILLRDDAEVSWHSLQQNDDASRSYQICRVQLKRNARFRSFHGQLGSRVARIDLECVLQGPGAEAVMRAGSFADGARHLDFHPTQVHEAPSCASHLYAKAVVKNSARNVYAGFIRVHEGAQHTDAYQKNRNLLLSSSARADSIPNLEIKANDVKCSHGATLGQIGEEELFYLQSRGLTRQQAERLLVEAFFQDLLVDIKHEAIRQRFSDAFLSRVTRGSL